MRAATLFLATAVAGMSVVAVAHVVSAAETTPDLGPSTSAPAYDAGMRGVTYDSGTTPQVAWDARAPSAAAWDARPGATPSTARAYDGGS